MAEIPALDSDAALWSAAPGERGDRPLLVLLHGYGADERDLFGLVPYLPPAYVVASVRAGAALSGAPMAAARKIAAEPDFNMFLIVMSITSGPR